MQWQKYINYLTLVGIILFSLTMVGYAQIQNEIGLQIQSGGIQVIGAGVNTNTTAFIHRAIRSNGYDCNDETCSATIIDNPMTNGDPNALLYVTPRTFRMVGLLYETNLQKWVIYHGNHRFGPAIDFNVLVIKS